MQQEEPPPLWEIEWRVLEIAAVCCELPAQSLTPDSRLLEDLGMDSLEVTEFIMPLEETFGVSIPDEFAAQFFTRSPVTLHMIAALVRERWDTRTPERDEWRRTRNELPKAEGMPFTQLGGVLSFQEWSHGTLYESIGPNREGYAQYRRRTDGMRCVLIPETAVLNAFLMDAEPVSNMAFARFLNSAETIMNLPQAILSEWCGVQDNDKRRAHFPLRRGQHGWEPIPHTEQQPMILVSWFGANAYALWANRRDWRIYRSDETIPQELRGISINAVAPPKDGMSSCLPSEAQWEYAARGPQSPHIPAEDFPQAEKNACVARHVVGTTYIAATLPAAYVSERLGMSPFGLHHMAGNVWQWCRDWYDPDFSQRPEAYERDSQNAEPTGIRSERGGSWVGPAKLAQPSYRRGRPPGVRGRCLGFRCIGVPE